MRKIVLILFIWFLASHVHGQSANTFDFKLTVGANSSHLRSKNQDILFNYSGLGWHLNGQLFFGNIHKFKILFGLEKNRFVNDKADRIVNGSSLITLQNAGEPLNIDSKFLKFGGGIRILIKHFDGFNIFLEPDLIFNLKLLDEKRFTISYDTRDYKTNSHLSGDLGLQVQYKKILLGFVYEHNITNVSTELDFLNKKTLRLELGYLF